MTKLPSYLNTGNKENITVDSLLVIIEQMYIDIAEAVNKKPDIYERTTDGQTTDTFLSNGSININTTTNNIEILAEHVSPIAVTWKTIS